MAWTDTLPTVRGKLLLNEPLGPYTWFRVGGAADALFIPADADDLADFLKALDSGSQFRFQLISHEDPAVLTADDDYTYVIKSKSGKKTVVVLSKACIVINITDRGDCFLAGPKLH